MKNNNSIVGAVCVALVALCAVGAFGGGDAQASSQPGQAATVPSSIGQQEYLTPAMQAVIANQAQAFGFKPEYIVAIGLSENLKNPEAVGDNGCSFGAYQLNICVHTQLEKGGPCNGKTQKEVALNFDCATYKVAYNIKHNLGCKIQADGSIPNHVECLSQWNGNNPPAWYANKIQKNGQSLGL